MDSDAFSTRQLDANHQVEVLVDKLQQRNKEAAGAGRSAVEAAIAEAGLSIIRWGHDGEAVVFDIGIQSDRTHLIAVSFDRSGRSAAEAKLSVRAVHGQDEQARFLTTSVLPAALGDAVAAAWLGGGQPGVTFTEERPFMRQQQATPEQRLIEAVRAVVSDTGTAEPHRTPVRGTD